MPLRRGSTGSQAVRSASRNNIVGDTIASIVIVSESMVVSIGVCGHVDVAAQQHCENDVMNLRAEGCDQLTTS
jgi:hypothetical protein